MTSVEGSLIVENVAGLVDLSMLANLETVGVDVYITGNPDLVSLTGLESLSEVGVSASSPPAGVVHFSANPQLADLRALEGLRTLLGMDFAGVHPALLDVQSLTGDLFIRPSEAGGLIAISGLPHVANLDGLLAIGTVEVGGSARFRVGIGGMDGLTDISGLSALSHLGDDLSLLIGALPLPALEFVGDGRLGALQISEYPVLSSLRLPGVDSIGLFVLSDGVPALHDLTGSEDLVHIDRLWIGACGGALDFGLESLAGLEPVHSIDELVIVGTPSLVSIDALTPGTVVGSVLIQDNAALPADEVLARLQLLDVRGPATVCNNLGDVACTRVPAACEAGPAPG